MPIVQEKGFFFKLSHRGTGYATGPTETIEHNVRPGSFSILVGLSRVQATTGGPLGAAVGIMTFGNKDFGPNPGDWETAQFGVVGSWTTAAQVSKGDLSAWELLQVWA